MFWIPDPNMCVGSKRQKQVLSDFCNDSQPVSSTGIIVERKKIRKCNAIQCF